MSAPRVSAVIIFLDAERFLAEAVDSVLAQTYSAWELLLVDDGSSDGSTALAREYAARDPARVRYLDHPRHANRGMSASRNLGLRHARGDYIAFLDADDVWLPRTLEQQVAVLDAHPEAAMVYGRAQWWYSWTGQLEDQARDFAPPLCVEPERLILPPTFLTRFVRQDDLAPCIGSAMLRRDVAEWVGGFEDAFRGLYEDQAFWAKVSIEAPIVAMDRCWSRYRQHPASACSVAQVSGDGPGARLMFLRWLRRYLSARDVHDDALVRALDAELWSCEHARRPSPIDRARALVRRVRHAVARADGA